MMHLHNIRGGVKPIPDDIKWFLLWLYHNRHNYGTRYKPSTNEIWRKNVQYYVGLERWNIVRYSSLSAYQNSCQTHGWYLDTWQDSYLDAFEIIYD